MPWKNILPTKLILLLLWPTVAFSSGKHPIHTSVRISLFLFLPTYARNHPSPHPPFRLGGHHDLHIKMVGCPLCMSLDVPNAVLYNPLVCFYPVPTSVPQLLGSVPPPQHLPNPFPPSPSPTTSQTCLGHLGQQRPPRFTCWQPAPLPLPTSPTNLCQLQCQQQLVSPSLNNTAIEPLAFSQKRPLLLLNFNSVEKLPVRQASPASTAAELSKPAKSHLFVLPLHIDQRQ